MCRLRRSRGSGSASLVGTGSASQPATSLKRVDPDNHLMWKSLFYACAAHYLLVVSLHNQGCGAGPAGAGRFCPQPKTEPTPPGHFTRSRSRVSCPEPEPSQCCTTTHPSTEFGRDAEPEPAHFARSRSRCNILLGAGAGAGARIVFWRRSRSWRRAPNLYGSGRSRRSSEPEVWLGGRRSEVGAAVTFYSEPEPELDGIVSCLLEPGARSRSCPNFQLCTAAHLAHSAWSACMRWYPPAAAVAARWYGWVCHTFQFFDIDTYIPMGVESGGRRGRVPSSEKFRRGRPPRFENEVTQIQCLFRLLGYLGVV